MPEHTTIEPAVLDDIPQLTELLYDLFSQEPDFRPDADVQMHGLKMILEQPNRGRIFVIRSQNAIIGMINLLFTISTAEGGMVILLEDLVISHQHRGQGFGTQLLEYAFNFAEKKNFLRITLLTDKINEATIRFYQKHGFLTSEMVPMRYWIKRENGMSQAGQEIDLVDLGHTRVDLARERRCGFPEVVFCEGKTAAQVGEIGAVLAEKHGLFLGTRASREHFEAVVARLPEAVYHERARCIVWQVWQKIQPRTLKGNVAIVCAGTSDLPVAEEARITLEAFGHAARSFTDVGIAGIHRLLAVRDEIEACDVIIVVAGMEGALPSAVSGLVSKPVIAVPTSVGYGASFGGLAALLGMLNSCGSGVTVVNIDNGFGAAYAAATILRLLPE